MSPARKVPTVSFGRRAPRTDTLRPLHLKWARGTKFAHKTGSGTTVLHDGGIVEGDHPFVLVCLCGDDDRFPDQAAQEAMANVGRVAYVDSTSSWADI